jgi:hypothetical protein
MFHLLHQVVPPLPRGVPNTEIRGLELASISNSASVRRAPAYLPVKAQLVGPAEEAELVRGTNRPVSAAREKA